MKEYGIQSYWEIVNGWVVLDRCAGINIPHTSDLDEIRAIYQQIEDKLGTDNMKRIRIVGRDVGEWKVIT